MPPLKRPSLKQKMFAKHYIANGGNATEAALASYDGDRNSAQVIGSQNLDKPMVIAEIDKLLKELGMDSDSWIADKLKQSIDNGMGQKATQKDALNALNMLLKIKSAYPANKSIKIGLNLKGELAPKNVNEIVNTVKSLGKRSNELIQDLTS